MANQTIAQLPYDLTDPESLKRFLGQLVDNLDVVLGYKGSTSYTTTADLKATTVSITQVSEALDTLKKSVEDNSSAVKTAEDDIADIESDVADIYKTQQLSNDYKDFNATVWSTLKGAFEFTSLGSDLVNAPGTITAPDTYNIYGISYKSNSSVFQTIWLQDAAVFDVYTRLGVNANWIKLN